MPSVDVGSLIGNGGQVLCARQHRSLRECRCLHVRSPCASGKVRTQRWSARRTGRPLQGVTPPRVARHAGLPPLPDVRHRTDGVRHFDYAAVKNSTRCRVGRRLALQYFRDGWRRGIQPLQPVGSGCRRKRAVAGVPRGFTRPSLGRKSWRRSLSRRGVAMARRNLEVLFNLNQENQS